MDSEIIEKIKRNTEISSRMWEILVDDSQLAEEVHSKVFCKDEFLSRLFKISRKVLANKLSSKVRLSISRNDFMF